jgi:hypothetical protein
MGAELFLFCRWFEHALASDFFWLGGVSKRRNTALVLAQRSFRSIVKLREYLSVFEDCNCLEPDAATDLPEP